MESSGCKRFYKKKAAPRWSTAKLLLYCSHLPEKLRFIDLLFAVGISTLLPV